MAQATAAVKFTPAAGAGTVRTCAAERDVRAQARGELRERGGDPVVGVRGHDHPGAAGVLPAIRSARSFASLPVQVNIACAARRWSCVASSRSA